VAERFAYTWCFVDQVELETDRPIRGIKRDTRKGDAVNERLYEGRRLLLRVGPFFDNQ
jgi:hypothetical protein